MAVSQTIINAYKRLYTVDQLKTAMQQALQDLSAGVVVTQINFQDGGGAGVPIKGDPAEVIEMMELAISQLEGGAVGPPPMMAQANFSFRRSET